MQKKKENQRKENKKSNKQSDTRVQETRKIVVQGSVNLDKDLSVPGANNMGPNRVIIEVPRVHSTCPSEPNVETNGVGHNATEHVNVLHGGVGDNTAGVHPTRPPDDVGRRDHAQNRSTSSSPLKTDGMDGIGKDMEYDVDMDVVPETAEATPFGVAECHMALD